MLLTEIGERPLLILDAKALFTAQLQGRYRWEVHMKLTYSEQVGSVVSSTLVVPVSLRYQHQREADALMAATTVLFHEVEALLLDQSTL